MFTYGYDFKRLFFGFFKGYNIRGFGQGSADRLVFLRPVLGPKISDRNDRFCSVDPFDSAGRNQSENGKGSSEMSRGVKWDFG